MTSVTLATAPATKIVVLDETEKAVKIHVRENADRRTVLPRASRAGRESRRLATRRFARSPVDGIRAGQSVLPDVSHTGASGGLTQLGLNTRGDAMGESLDPFEVGAFHHHAGQWLRAGKADQHPAGGAE